MGWVFSGIFEAFKQFPCAVLKLGQSLVRGNLISILLNTSGQKFHPKVACFLPLPTWKVLTVVLSDSFWVLPLGCCH